MISRTSKSSILQNFAKSRSMLAGNTAYDPAATWLIQRTTAAGGETSITFGSIPNTYKHLQIRGIAKDTIAGQHIILTLNSDSNPNFAYHRLSGDGSSTAASGSSSGYGIVLIYADFGTTYFSGTILDILDYTSTSKYKTVKSLSGSDANGSGGISLGSGLWISTSAITTITLTPPNAFAAGTTFALYGIKG